MKMRMSLMIALIAMPFSISAFANPIHCEYRPPQDGDTSVNYPVRGEPAEKSYSYLVKKDVMGDGKTLVFYPVYSKSWLLTAGQLREIVMKEHFNIIGDDEHQPQITVIHNPTSADDFKSFKEIYLGEKADQSCKG